jgi:O-succinylbenzoic acid--CoA ligase
MAQLVALDLPLGPALVDEIRHAHDRGHAVCVLDQRVTAARQRELLEVLAPTVIVDARGERTRRPEGREVEPGDGLVVLTSGTSGRPKAAVLTWTAVIASAELTSQELYRGRPTRWNACLPPAHVGGFAVLARSLFTEDALVWGDARHLEDGPSRGATHVAVVRAQLFRFDLGGYQVVLLGGSRPPSELAANVVTTWGMTETGSGVVYNRRPLPGVDVAVVNDEILVRSPTLLRTYRDAPAPLVTGPDGRAGWLATGDGGELVDGELFVHGRLGWVITTGGEKVWPEDLEAVLANVEGVADVAVAGVEDPEWGERVTAYVVSDLDATTLTPRLAEAAGAAIGPWAKPKDVLVVPAIARTASGKIRRDEIARWAQPTPPVG